MRKSIPTLPLAVFILFLSSIASPGQAKKTAYPAMAPLAQYLIADQKAEVALARSAAPASVSSAAEVMVLGRDGYRTAAKGTNGFVCIVERSWGAPTDDPEFWNPKVRAPHCFNPAAATTFLPVYLLKTRQVLAGKPRAEIAAGIASALERRQLPPLAPGAMVYMMSRQQYLNDTGMSWHPHLMFIVSGHAEKSWGANLPGSPVIAVDDPEERATVFMMMASQWSDGTTGPSMSH
jgi:hypothetical protein